MEASRIERRDEATSASRWRRWGNAVTRVAVAGMLFAAGIIYTVGQVHPPFRRPGNTPVLSGTSPLTLFNREVGRVAAVLQRYTKDSSTAQRIAGAIVEEGKRRSLDPALLVGVLLTEDQTLDTMARSTVGARGLMQVMPMHGGKWGCNSANLFDIESNICHGASILQDVMRNAPNTRIALLRYNGCVHGRNTRNCHTYPDKVLSAANRTTEQLIALAE